MSTTAPARTPRSIPRVELEKRVRAGLKDRIMTPEVAAEAMQTYAAETNRLNRERRSNSDAWRMELAKVGGEGDCRRPLRHRGWAVPAVHERARMEEPER
jgi:hypothetical protein